MWVQAGQQSDIFWDQTPRHFQIVMGGVRKRMESEAQARTVYAYEAGAFAGLAYHGKLKSLAQYTRKGKVQTPREMAATIQALGARSNMKIRRIERQA
jgi:hypothetical protein